MLLKSKSRSSLRSIWAITLIANLLLITLLYLANIFVGIENFSDYISLPIYTIIPGALVLLSILAYTQSNRIQEISKRSLFFLVLSFGCSFAAEQTWNLYDHVLDIDPYPSIADIFYVAAPLFMFVSLVLFLRPLSHKISKKNVIFAGMISFTVLIPSIIITFNVGAEDEPIEIMIALLYPIVDSILLVPAIIAILFSVKGKKNFFWLMILSGIIVVLIADTIFLFLIIDDAYEDGHPVDILWVSSYTIWAFMMYYILHNSRKNTSKESERQPQIYAQYKMERFEKFGVLITLLLINISIAIILISINYFLDVDKDDVVLVYFSWFLIIIVIIFSSIVLLLNSKLNNTLQKRTVKLGKLSDELIKAERFSAIGELAARLAHDLRNPLAIITVSNELLKKQSNDEVVTKNSILIERSLSRMQHQIDKVMDFVRIKPINSKNISLEKLIELSLANINIPERVTLEKPKQNPEINCDSEQLSVALNNIILNAVQKFENKGSISIIYEANNSYHFIKIQDSGDPIPEKNIDKIFEPLFTTKQQGTGLGLASCKRIVDEHKGQLSVSNNPTTFTIKIPM